MSSGQGAGGFTPTQATTILAFKFADGVLVAGDRRATAGNTVVYDRADKVLEIDRHSIMAIAGVPATAWEMATRPMIKSEAFAGIGTQNLTDDGKQAIEELFQRSFGDPISARS